MLKDLLLRKMLASKLKDVPAEEREKILSMLQKNPDFFQQFASEVQGKIASGQDQMAAVMAVMKEHETELKEIMK